VKRTFCFVLVVLGVTGLMTGIASAKTKKVSTKVSFGLVSSPDGDSFDGVVSAGHGCAAGRQVTISGPSGTFGSATTDASGSFTVPGNGTFTSPDLYTASVAQTVIKSGKKYKCLSGHDSVDLGGGGGGLGGGTGGA
jgi:hypothetical protein